MISIYSWINGFRYCNVFDYVIDEDINIAKICSSTVNSQQQQTKLTNDDILIKIIAEFINKDGSVMLPTCNIQLFRYMYIYLLWV